MTIPGAAAAATEQPRKYFLSPFASLRLNNQLNHGGQALILSFPGLVVFKCPITWGYQGELPARALKGAQIQEQIAHESISQEKNVFRVLQSKPHQNIIRATMIVPEGIFLPRMRSTLEDRLVGHRILHYPECYISEELKLRWAGQIVSAAAWLETLGYAHGDITPRNVLLDTRDNIKLCDFGESVPIDGESQCGAPPFVPWIFDTRNYMSEQYSAGWTLYNLYRDIPDGFNDPETLDEIQSIEFPPLDGIKFAPIINRCWRFQYKSISALDRDVRGALATEVRLYRRLFWLIQSMMNRAMDMFTHWILHYRCKRIYATLRKSQCSSS